MPLRPRSRPADCTMESASPSDERRPRRRTRRRGRRSGAGRNKDRKRTNIVLEDNDDDSRSASPAPRSSSWSPEPMSSEAVTSTELHDGEVGTTWGKDDALLEPPTRSWHYTPLVPPLPSPWTSEQRGFLPLSLSNGPSSPLSGPAQGFPSSCLHTDTEIDAPRAYHADYPHPLSVYASPAVNPAAVAASGYAPALAALDRRTSMGNILYESRKDLSAPALMLPPASKEGCGIPERYWLRLSAWAGVKVPLGAVVPGLRMRRCSMEAIDDKIHVPRNMGPRRASLPNIYHRETPPVVIPRQSNVGDPRLTHASLPFRTLPPVTEAEDDNEGHLQPIGAERSKYHRRTGHATHLAIPPRSMYAPHMQAAPGSSDTIAPAIHSRALSSGSGFDSANSITPVHSITPPLGRRPSASSSELSSPSGLEDEHLRDLITRNLQLSLDARLRREADGYQGKIADHSTIRTIPRHPSYHPLEAAYSEFNHKPQLPLPPSPHSPPKSPHWWSTTLDFSTGMSIWA